MIISAPGCILSAPALTQFDTALSLFRENQHIAIQPTNAVVNMPFSLSQFLQDLNIILLQAVLGEMRHKAYVAMAQVESPVNLRALKVHQNHSDLQLQQNVRGLNGTYQQKSLDNSSGALPAWSGANIENWRDYATPAGTPLGRHTELPPDDAIHVDITPEEPMTEHSNWQTFIYQFQNNDRSTSHPHC
ncbi:MAG TPA: hypothetical protein VGO47_08115 [Chlamydiales bacterium]|nr:hypothetical protein [Chlamydiales bacterium]